MDRVLILLPKELEYFIPAVSVFHSYVLHLRMQAQQGFKKDIVVTIDVGTEENLFFAPLFPRFGFPQLQLVINDWEIIPRQDWDCVLDFRDQQRAMDLAETSKKHITEAWNILFGSSGSVTPMLGYLGAQVKIEDRDVIIDGTIPFAGALAKTFSRWYPSNHVEILALNTMRPGNIFQHLVHAKLYVGPKSGASYLAATMGKGLLELYPDSVPSWWMAKPKTQNYRALYGSIFTVEMTWKLLEEMWAGICIAKYQKEMQMVQSVSTAATAIAR